MLLVINWKLVKESAQFHNSDIFYVMAPKNRTWTFRRMASGSLARRLGCIAFDRSKFFRSVWSFGQFDQFDLSVFRSVRPFAQLDLLISSLCPTGFCWWGLKYLKLEITGRFHKGKKVSYVLMYIDVFTAADVVSLDRIVKLQNLAVFWSLYLCSFRQCFDV
jgi:hypothetical protein